MIAHLARLMPALTPWQFWTLASFGGWCLTLIALSVGGRGEADDDGAAPIPLFDRDSLLVEVMTRTPEGYRFAAPAAARHDGDCRTRSVHPAT